MAEFSLDQLVAQGLGREVQGDGRVAVRGIRHDSRRVEAGDLFVALDGEQVSGADYARDAVSRGAVAVFSERPLDVGVPVLLSEDALASLSRIATELYEDPTQQLACVGITGPNGKTTTACLVESVLATLGKRPTLVGTVAVRGPGGERPVTHTTPMADDLMRICRWAADAGSTHLVVEVSSHALAMHRADGVRHEVAAFTNLSQDHLDYHGDLATYFEAKARLFEALDPKVSVINVDDAYGRRLVGRAKGRLLRCSTRAEADAELRVLSWEGGGRGLRARVATPQGEVTLVSPLIGEHNLENLLVAFGCALGLGLPGEAVAQALAQAAGAPGRLERIDHPGGALVFVDYAHTPDALARVLRVLRPATQGRLRVVFGCGGDRDRKKRPLMGQAAAEVADQVVLTSDNPRSESPVAILDEIEPAVAAQGLSRVGSEALAGAGRAYAVEPDRRAAIDLAVRGLGQGDCLLIAGKGHEKVQILGDRREPFDDREQARQAIARQREGQL